MQARGRILLKRSVENARIHRFTNMTLYLTQTRLVVLEHRVEDFPAVKGTVNHEWMHILLLWRVVATRSS